MKASMKELSVEIFAEYNEFIENFTSMTAQRQWSENNFCIIITIFWE
jgi:hypothetical protein